MMTDVAVAKASASNPLTHTGKEDVLLFTLKAFIRCPQSYRFVIWGQTGECYHSDWGPFTRVPQTLGTAMVWQKVAMGHANIVTRLEEIPGPFSPKALLTSGAHPHPTNIRLLQLSSGEASRNCWALMAVL